jgi:Ca2+/Na+ antiporter
MTEFGVATILGSVCFATCFIPAVAHLVNYGLLKPSPEPTELELSQNSKLLAVFTRDMAFIIVGLTAFYYFLDVGAVTQVNLLLFLFLFALYCFAFYRSTQH